MYVKYAYWLSQQHAVYIYIYIYIIYMYILLTLNVMYLLLFEFLINTTYLKQ
jgi:uncharacterized membrane protein